MPFPNFIQVGTQIQTVSAPPLNYIPIAGIPSTTTLFAEAARQYASVSEMTDAGFTASSNEVLAATQIFNQPESATLGRVTRVVVARLETGTAQVDTFNIDGTTDGDYVISISDIGGTAVQAATFSATGNSVTEIKDGLVAAFNAGPFGATQTAASVDADSATVTADVVGVPFVLTIEGPTPADVSTATTTPNVGAFESLEAAWTASPFWAVVPHPSTDPGVMVEMSRWAEQSAALLTLRRNICLVQDDDTGTLTGAAGTLAQRLLGLNRTRTFGVHHANATDNMTAAWFGRYGGQPAGARAWHFGRLQGSSVTAGLNYTVAQVEQVLAQRWSIVERDGPALTSPLRINGGQGSGSNYVVQKQAEDAWWFAIRLAVQGELESPSGVNIDDAGVEQVSAAINSVNIAFGLAGAIDLGNTTITFVPPEDVPATERANGIYRAPNGGFTVNTVLVPKLRRVGVEGFFAV